MLFEHISRMQADLLQLSNQHQVSHPALSLGRLLERKWELGSEPAPMAGQRVGMGWSRRGSSGRRRRSGGRSRRSSSATSPSSRWPEAIVASYNWEVGLARPRSGRRGTSSSRPPTFAASSIRGASGCGPWRRWALLMEGLEQVSSGVLGPGGDGSGAARAGDADVGAGLLPGQPRHPPPTRPLPQRRPPRPPQQRPG